MNDAKNPSDQSDDRQQFPKANLFWRVAPPPAAVAAKRQRIGCQADAAYGDAAGGGVDTPTSHVAGRGLGGRAGKVTMHWRAMCCGVLLLTVSVAVEAYAGTITGKVTASSVKGTRDTAVYIDRIEGVEFPVPATPAVLRQINKEFIPHVLPILKGSSVSFSNSDGILHNVHLYQGRRSLFNLATPAGAAPITKTFREPGEVAVLCDVHPEMSAYILVLETPYAAVTTEDGRYTIADVPPGTYTLKTWYEKLKPVTTAVTVEGEDTVEVNVELK